MPFYSTMTNIANQPKWRIIFLVNYFQYEKHLHVYCITTSDRRKHVSKFRLSLHSLEFETGSYLML